MVYRVDGKSFPTPNYYWRGIVMEREPLNVEKELKKAVRLYEAGNFNQAVTYLGQLLQKTTLLEDRIRVKLELGKTWLEVGDNDKALAILQDAHATVEENIQTNQLSTLKRALSLYMSTAYQGKGNSKKAAILCQEIISEQIEGAIQVRAYQDLGYIHFSQENFEETIADLEKALNLDPGFEHLFFVSDVFYILGWTYGELGQIDMAIQYLEKAVEAFKPEGGDVALWEIQLALGHILQQPADSDINIWIGYYHKIIERIDPESKKANRLFTRRRKKLLSPKEGKLLLETYLQVGSFHFDRGEYTEAIQYLTRGLNTGSQAQPYFAKTYFILGTSYLRAGNGRKARKAFQMLSKIDPEHQWVEAATTHLSLGKAYYKEKKFKQALKHHLKVFDLEGVSPAFLTYTHLGLGHTYLSMSKFELAAEHYREYLKLSDPKAPERKAAMDYLVYANEALAKRS